MGMYIDSDSIPKYYNNKEFDNDTEITIDEVDAHIVTQEAIVNSRLRTKYSVPITEAADLPLIKTIVEYLVVCQLDRIWRESERTETAQFNYKRNMCKSAEDILSKIDDGTIELATPKEDNAPIFFNNIGSNGESVSPFFTVSKGNPKNWDCCDMDSSCNYNNENDTCL